MKTVLFISVFFSKIFVNIFVIREKHEHFRFDLNHFNKFFTDHVSQKSTQINNSSHEYNLHVYIYHYSFTILLYFPFYIINNIYFILCFSPFCCHPVQCSCFQSTQRRRVRRKSPIFAHRSYSKRIRGRMWLIRHRTTRERSDQRNLKKEKNININVILLTVIGKTNAKL